jgi:hypothetical protein
MVNELQGVRQVAPDKILHRFPGSVLFLPMIRALINPKNCSIARAGSLLFPGDTWTPFLVLSFVFTVEKLVR